MNCKKGMIILIITVFLFSIAGVCASDANTTAMAMVDEHTTEEIDEISSAPSTGEKLELTSSEMLGNTKTVTEHTFNAIEKEIDNDTIIYLEPGKYTGTSEIKINSINNLKIIGNSTILDAEKKTRIINITDSTNITLQGITFTNATANIGGAIYLENSANCKVADCIFTNNNGIIGGAIGGYYSPNGTITNTTLTNNTATQSGGAISWYESPNGIITNTTLTNNTATSGGAIFWGTSDNGTITSNIFTNNNATYDGGAIRWYESPNGIITNTTLTNNNATFGGAIVWFNSPHGKITNTTLTNNNANQHGGAIEWYNSPNGKITNTTLTNNNATTGGAITWLSSDNGTITSSIFTNNNAQNNTIHIDNEYSGENLTVNNNIFLNNNATEIGFYKTDTTSNTDYNWFGHNETNYKNNPKIENCKIWLFLNATANPNPTSILDTSNLTFKLWMYNSSNENTSEYDSTLLKPVNLTVTSTSGLTTNAQLGKAVTFQPTAIGTDMITAKIENAEYTKTLTVTDGTTFLDLNRTINGNKNDTIILDRDYTYNQTTDYNLKDGIIISHKVTIIGNGHTINATGKARIFQIKSDNVTIQKTTFTNATANIGGAIYLENSANCKVADCIFTNNSAQKFGGAIHWEYSNNGKIISSIFTNNNATTEGGAINWRYSPNGTITNTTLTNNSATYYGGAISWNESPNGKITNTKLTNNTVQGNGGAIYWNYGDNGTIANTTLTNNNAQEFGGAIFWDGSSNGTIANTTLTNNNAQKFGGAISWSISPNGKITNTTLTNNSATYYGGAIFWEYSSNGKIISSIFTNNNADEGGAIYWGDCDNGKITSNIFTNHPPQDNIISLHPGHNSTINNNIFLNNNAREILVNQYDTTQNTDYNWFGHNETNYKNNRNIENCKIWLFLNATANPNPTSILDTSNITFKLWMYNSTNENTSEYDNTLLKPVNLTVTSTSGLTTSTQLGKAITYKPTAIGTDIITAKIENASYTIYLNVNKADSNLSLVDEEVPYSENTTLTLNYNSNATGKVNITLTGKKHNQKITDINLNTTICLENILPDEYDITVKYSGDETFLNTTATGKLTVLKLESNINAQSYDINVTDKKGLMFIITLPENATGNLTINNEKTINIEKEGKKEKGKLTINITNNAYSVGEYKWTFTYLGDDIYNNSTDQATSNILIIQTAITPENKTIELTFEEESKINYTTQPDNLKEIKFESNNTNIVTVDADGFIKAVGAGQAKIIIKFNGNENYTASNATVTVTVNKANSTLTVSDVTFDYGQRGSANTTFTGASGIVAVVNDLGAVVEINGNVITIFNLTAGKYRLTVTTVPDANHEETTEFADVTVNKIDSDVDVAVPVIYYGTSADVTATYDGATGIVAEIDGKNLTVKGNVIAIPDDLDAGEYNLTVTTVPDSNHNEISKDFTFSVNPVNSTLDVDDAETVYGRSVEVNVTYEGATGIAAEIDGKNLSVKGNVIAIPDDLDAGEYKLTVTTVPDSNHEAVSKQATVTVNKMETEILAQNIKTTYNVDRKLTITLKDSENKAIAGEKITVNINGEKTYTTDKNGQVQISTKGLASDTYQAKIAFDGSANYKNSAKNISITVKKATPKLTAKNKAFKSGDKTKKYSISLKDNLGKPMKNVWVKLTIAKTTYKAKTNAKGIATFKLSKLSKTSKATVKYVGGKNYKAASKKVKLTVKSAFKTISYGSKNHLMVKKIQRALKNNGYYLTAHGHYLKIDGIFHEWTELAVIQFQKANGLKVTGKVDEKTAKKLKII
ncbi:right-handed parallel beta-helix repeat-containing protein [Methanobrevibacter sp.]|uniref:right-handed parallel beta-helix repeat-containing protein n=1 Tax=Methanobrevibacter sp. TaxID=66852 RepID=UPI003866DC3A